MKRKFTLTVEDSLDLERFKEENCLQDEHCTDEEAFEMYVRSQITNQCQFESLELRIQKPKRRKSKVLQGRLSDPNWNK